jgi:hypothetical protein
MLKIFVDISGEANIEDLKPRFHFVDEVDGHHLITKEAIFIHDKHTRPGLMLLWGGSGLPLSFNTEEGAAKQDVSDSDFYKSHQARISVSKRWPRMFAWFFRWLLRWFYFIFGCFCLGFGLYIVVILAKVML